MFEKVDTASMVKQIFTKDFRNNTLSIVHALYADVSFLGCNPGTKISAEFNK